MTDVTHLLGELERVLAEDNLSSAPEPEEHAVPVMAARFEFRGADVRVLYTMKELLQFAHHPPLSVTPLEIVSASPRKLKSDQVRRSLKHLEEGGYVKTEKVTRQVGASGTRRHTSMIAQLTKKGRETMVTP